jgi:hypothetical protein
MFKVGLFIAQSGFLRYTTQTQIPWNCLGIGCLRGGFKLLHLACLGPGEAWQWGNLVHGQFGTWDLVVKKMATKIDDQKWLMWLNNNKPPHVWWFIKPYKTHLWWFGGWFIIVLTTLYTRNLCLSLCDCCMNIMNHARLLRMLIDGSTAAQWTHR